MKFILLLLWMAALPLLAKEKEPSAADKVTTAAITRLEKRIATAILTLRREESMRARD